ncbi:MAG TPA: Rne/Rng family ribonuclease, partial [Trebonia sp.]
LVYVPGASMTGISRKLPDTERTRLKQILKKVTPENAGVIVRTAAEGAAEAELDRDITRLAAQWESIEKKAKTASAPALLYGEPDLTVRVVRDVFNEDFHKLIVSGDEGWEIIDEYVRYVAPHLAERISRWDTPDNEDADEDVFAAYRIDEQLAKAMERKVWLPSGGSLVIDRTEAMTVIDVNTGKFTGQGGNLEETVTRNNLEAAEEIVRQLRLRDVGGIIVIDFIDMVLESNRELVLRRLLECLARDRTKHQVAEVTSLGLVQMTRKRVGAGLLEAFSTPCECCNGRGVIVTLDAPPEPAHRASAGTAHRPVPVPAPLGQAPGNGHGNGNGNGKGNGSGNGKGGGYANGRRNGRRDEERNLRDVDQDTAADSTAPVDASRSDANKTDANRAVTAVTGDATSAPGDATATGTAGNGTRPRRSTSAGTAFATAVTVEDAPPVTVTTVSTDAAPVSAATETAEPSARPVRRTRTGSAVARVSIVSDPAPEPQPEQAPATTAASATATDTEEAPADEAAATTADEPAPAFGTQAWAADEPAPATEAAAPLSSEPTIVSASVFGTSQSIAETPAVEAMPATDQDPEREAAGEPAPEAAAPAEAVPGEAGEAPAPEAAPADQGGLEATGPDAAGEATPTEEPTHGGDGEGEHPTWA